MPTDDSLSRRSAYCWDSLILEEPNPGPDIRSRAVFWEEDSLDSLAPMIPESYFATRAVLSKVAGARETPIEWGIPKKLRPSIIRELVAPQARKRGDAIHNLRFPKTMRKQSLQKNASGPRRRMRSRVERTFGPPSQSTENSSAQIRISERMSKFPRISPSRHSGFEVAVGASLLGSGCQDGFRGVVSGTIQSAWARLRSTCRRSTSGSINVCGGRLFSEAETRA